MYASDTLTRAGQSWRAAADALLAEAERIGPLDQGVFGELGTDQEGEAAALRIDEKVDALLTEGERAFAELQDPAATSGDARFQATSLLVGTLAIGDALSVAGRSPSDVFAELSVQDAQTATFGDARTTLAEAYAIVKVPTALPDSLEKIEAVGAAESWKVLTGSVGQLAGGALVNGLNGVLTGAAAAAFDAVRETLSSWHQALKRAVVRIAKWVVDKIRALLPEAMAERVDLLVQAIQEKLESGIGQIATDVYGRILGRDETAKAWTDAAAAGQDLSQAESKLAGVTAAHVARVAWVTKGRKIIDKYEATVAVVVGHLPPPAQLAFAALVAAVLGFVALQVWDGFNDIEELV